MPKNKANMDIRLELFKNDISITAFEKYCGWSATTLSRVLRRELPQEKKDVLFDYIAKMSRCEPSPGKPWDSGGMVQRPWLDPTVAASQFGQNVIAELNKRGIKQNWLAKQIGKQPQSLSRVLYDSSNPRLDVVIKCADALEMSVDALIGRDGYAE